MTTDTDWISTGKAAKILGYHPDWFAKKFDGILPMRRTLGGHRRWLESAVREMVDPHPAMPAAG
jgi:hypothetical protein